MKAQVAEVHGQRDARIAQAVQGYTERRGWKGDSSCSFLLLVSMAVGYAALSIEL